MQPIVPFLWFDGQAEEAANFYCSVFKNSRICSIMRCPDNVAEASGQPADSVLTVKFEINGQPFVALNAGPLLKFNEAVSFMFTCETSAELDEIWEKLLDGGEAQMCGWLKDKFGLSWQIVPKAVEKMIADPDPTRCERVMDAVMSLIKLDWDTLQKAYDGKG